jgi:hypothetical protein
MRSRTVRSALAMLGISVASVLAPPVTNSAEPWRFHLEEATIADVHRAIRANQITRHAAGEPLFQTHRGLQRHLR